jgi:hypothetical protein
MNSLWLEDSWEGIKATWNHLRPDLLFLTKMKKISQFYRSYCKRKAQSFRAEETAARHHLVEFTLQLNNSPDDPLIQQHHGQVLANPPRSGILEN